MSSFLSLELSEQEIIDVLSKRLEGRKINDPAILPPARTYFQDLSDLTQKAHADNIRQLDDIARTLAAIPEWDTIAPMEAPRSGGWARLAKIHLSLHPDCGVCETKKLCVPHHIKPFHIHPEFELDPDNLITLCPPHHLLFGHLMNWRAFNPHVVADCIAWKASIKNRPLAAPMAALSLDEVQRLTAESLAKCNALFAAHLEIV